MSAQPTTNQLAWQVGTATVSRFLLNTARRFIYPFAPALSRGLGVPLPAITSLETELREHPQGTAGDGEGVGQHAEQQRRHEGRDPHRAPARRHQKSSRIHVSSTLPQRR